MSAARPGGRPRLPAGSPREGPDRHYLDVAALRIQTWLGRTKGLKLRRGASVMLTEMTSREHWSTRLPAGTCWNDEAGDKPGVVTLRVESGVPRDRADGIVGSAARAVVEELRTVLQHLPVQAVTGTGPTYLQAYPGMQRSRREGTVLLDCPAAPFELFVARPCAACHQAPAEVTVRTERDRAGHPEVEQWCRECVGRRDSAGLTTGSGDRAPATERRLLRALTDRPGGGRFEGFTDVFPELAAEGRDRADDAASQLALVYADGNRVGAFLAGLAQGAGNERVFRPDVVRALDETTVEALADAVAATMAGGGPIPVLPHVAGGDDLVLSVPARYAWPFVLELVDAFSRRMEQRCREWGLPGGTAPTLSAGLVFHHHKHPFFDADALADRHLQAAKAHGGTRPAVSFVDVTSDGTESRIPHEHLVEDLRGRAALLSELAAVPQSHRATLTALCRRALAQEALPGRPSAAGPAAPARAPSKGPAAETPRQALARRIVDLGYRAVKEVVVPAGDNAAIREALLERGNRSPEHDPVRRLRGELDLARWWPAAGGAA